MTGFSQRLLFDSLTPLLAFEGVHLIEHTEEVLNSMAEEIQASAQDNAPWEDRTGLARSGLTAEVTREGLEVVLSLYHTVEYGKWLELIQSGRYAIIMPTLEKYAAEVMRKTHAVESGGGSGGDDL